MGQFYFGVYTAKWVRFRLALTRLRKRIVYRVVDEYDSKYELARKSSSRPLTLGELIRFMDHSIQHGCVPGLVWSIVRMNIDAMGDAESMRGFIAVSSSFYPELGLYYETVIEEYLDALLDDSREVEPEVD